MWVDLLIACSIWIVCGFVGIQVSLRISSESELREILDEWETKDFFLILAGGPCILICIIIDIVSQKWHKIRVKHPGSIWNVLIDREIKRRHKKENNKYAGLRPRIASRRGFISKRHRKNQSNF